MIPTTKVNGSIHDQTGEPYTGPVVFRLSQTVRDPDHGIITPSDIQVEPDDGVFEVSLWPNSRGEQETFYRLTAGDDPLTVVVPEQAEADLVDLIQ